jgi:hypothetical protein
MRGYFSSLDKDLFVKSDANRLSRLGSGENRFDIKRFDRADVSSFI